MDMKHDPQSLLTELNARRAECHRKVDEQINMELCRLALGDKTEDFLGGGGELLPFSVSPAVFKGRKPSSIILRGQEIGASTWRQAALILRDCCADPRRRKQMMKLRGLHDGPWCALLAETPKGMRSPIRICRNLYFESHFDSENMMRILVSRILDEVGYDYQSAVVICRKPRQGGIAVEEVMADHDHDLEVEPALSM